MSTYHKTITYRGPISLKIGKIRDSVVINIHYEWSYKGNIPSFDRLPNEFILQADIVSIPVIRIEQPNHYAIAFDKMHSKYRLPTLNEMLRVIEEIRENEEGDPGDGRIHRTIARITDANAKKYAKRMYRNAAKMLVHGIRGFGIERYIDVVGWIKLMLVYIDKRSLPANEAWLEKYSLFTIGDIYPQIANGLLDK